MSRNILDMPLVWCSYKIYPSFTCAEYKCCVCIFDCNLLLLHSISQPLY